MRSPVPAVGAFLSLFLGFGVADLTGVRWLGGIVLLIIGVISGFYLLRLAGLGRALVFAVAVVIGFIVSHPLGSILGAYGSLSAISLIVAVIIYSITPRQVAA